jgi:histidine triad (HIT) family protein
MHAEAHCIFCQIVAGQSPSFRVHEDAETYVFMDLFPVTAGHTLVIPKAHAENIYEADAEAVAAVGRSTKRVADAIRAEIAPDGLGVFQLNGAAAGQTVFHLHTHLIPRWGGDELALHSRVRGDDAVLAQIAGQLSRALR